MRTLRVSLLVVIALGAAAVVSAQSPQWLWAQPAGGDNSDHAYAITRDNTGNLYVAGDFTIQASFGNFNLSSDQAAAFVARLDSAGNWIWAVSATGSGACYASSIDCDSVGNIYVTGNFRNQVNFGNHSLVSEGMQDVFVAKLDGSGNWLWATQGGGTDSDYGVGIAVDDSGQAYVTGSFGDTADFGQISLSINPEDWICDIFIAKLDVNGNWLWANRAGGSDPDSGNGVALDGSGNCYVTGVFYDDVADFGPDIFTANQCDCLFISKLDSAGNWLWTRRAGGIWPCYAYGRDVTADSQGNCYATGMFSHIIDFGPTSLTCLDEQDIFVCKLDAAGNWLWSRRAGGTSYNEGHGIECDPAGNCFVAGYFYGMGDFGPNTLSSEGLSDLFVAALDSGGNWLWSLRGGGYSYDTAQGMASTSAGQLNICGSFSETAVFGPDQIISSGGTDVLVLGLSATTGVAEAYQITDDNMLRSVHPNPCQAGASTVISFELPAGTSGTLEIFNLRGQGILATNHGPGLHSFEWDTTSLPPGLYFCRLVFGKHQTVKKLMLLP